MLEIAMALSLRHREEKPDRPSGIPTREAVTRGGNNREHRRPQGRYVGMQTTVATWVRRPIRGNLARSRRRRFFANPAGWFRRKQVSVR